MALWGVVWLREDEADVIGNLLQHGQRLQDLVVPGNAPGANLGICAGGPQ